MLYNTKTKEKGIIFAAVKERTSFQNELFTIKQSEYKKLNYDRNEKNK